MGWRKLDQGVNHGVKKSEGSYFNKIKKQNAIDGDDDYISI